METCEWCGKHVDRVAVESESGLRMCMDCLDDARAFTDMLEP